jgi:membrane protease YdiL (CAAX protease family)
MRSEETGYLAATRHPWPCFLFLLPLLTAYESSVCWLGGTRPEALRNGADTWLHWGLEAFGFSQLYWVPGLVAVVFLLWSWKRRDDRPRDLPGVCIGMAMESLAFAGGLWGLSRGLGPFLDSLGITLDCPPMDPALSQLITFVGAGIYEEVLFRLFLFAGLRGLLVNLEVGSLQATLLAGVSSALLFALAHHIGPYGEDFDGFIFLFRTLAGLYFAAVFQFRGFGIAVGAHACYDVLVGLAMR